MLCLKTFNARTSLSSILYLFLSLTTSVIAHPLTQSQTSSSSACTPNKFTFPSILGTSLLSVTAEHVQNYTGGSLTPGTSQYGTYTISFCNVTIAYTHPGWNDTINVQIWLLESQSWNGRLQALGGGGYSASFGPIYSIQAVAKGYVALNSDAGHPAGMETATSPKGWALNSLGNVNLYLLEDFASRSLHEMAIVGKSITGEFYGKKPEYSYFSGCSGGGRQGLMIAQRYAEDFDGILAAAPAISIETFIPAGYWAQQVMKNLQTYPRQCEIEGFTKAAIENCDALDGMVDGIITKPSLCKFQASSVVGQEFSCDNTTRQFTSAGAQIVQAAWDGPLDPSGKIGWFGLNKDASLTDTYVATNCVSNGTCSATPTELLTSWIKYFVVKDPNWNASEMTNEQFYSYIKQSNREYNAMIGAADPDLSGLRTAGGKLLVWHGLADQVIPPAASIAYSQQVMDQNPNADSFYKFFEAPGVGHCYGGVGHQPNGAFDQLVHWVENGTAPHTLLGTNPAGHDRELCSYPDEQVYIGGDVNDVGSFECVAKSFGAVNGDRAVQFPMM